MREVLIGLAAAGIVILLLLQNSLFPIILLAGLFFFLFRFNNLKTPRVGAIGKSKTAGGRINFNYIGGQEQAKKELLEALEFIVKPKMLAKMGIRPLKGIMLVGPPGTGKTLLAKAASNYTHSSFVNVAGSEFIEIYAGVGAQRVRQVFEQCRSQALRQGKNSGILFIDEIDILGGKRGSHSSHLEYDQTLNQLLVEMDGLETGGQVQILVIGATNRPEALDPALIRPGRFDRVVQVELPDLEGRHQILKLHLRNKPLHREVSVEKIARETFGFSGAHLESVANEAAILAMREGHTQIKDCHLLEAVEKVILGEKMDRKPEAEEIWRIAVHESGHALIGEHVKPGSVSSVTITPRGKALGYIRRHPERDYYLYTREHLEKQIAVLLGGSAGEKIVLGDQSTGSESDFNQAVDLAKKMVASGLSPLGIVSTKDLPRALLHQTIQQIIHAQEQWVLSYLSECKELITGIARHLLDREKISGDILRQTISQNIKAG